MSATSGSFPGATMAGGHLTAGNPRLFSGSPIDEISALGPLRRNRVFNNLRLEHELRLATQDVISTRGADAEDHQKGERRNGPDEELRPLHPRVDHTRAAGKRIRLEFRYLSKKPAPQS